MKILDKKQNQIVFEADIEDSLANSIRRYLLRVDVPAIDEVEISKNGSPLYDETISHRLGLIPIKAKGAKDGNTLKLNSKTEGAVYSKELSGDCEVVYDSIPITHLEKGQEIEIVATIKIGQGIEHARFSPGAMFYRNECEISVPKELKEKLLGICKNNEMKEKGDKIIVMDNKSREVCDVCEGLCQENDLECETSVKDSLIITIESFGQMESEEIFTKAVDALKKDLAEVAKKLK